MNTQATQQFNSREPDSLLETINKSHFAQGVLISFIVHIAFVGVTSFKLYADWAEYGISSPDRGFHTPSDIKDIKRARIKEAEEAEQKAKLEERVKAQEAAQAEEDAKAKEEGAAGADTNATSEAGTTDKPLKAPTIKAMAPASLDDTPTLLDEF